MLNLVDTRGRLSLASVANHSPITVSDAPVAVGGRRIDPVDARRDRLIEHLVADVARRPDNEPADPAASRR